METPDVSAEWRDIIEPAYVKYAATLLDQSIAEWFVNLVVCIVSSLTDDAPETQVQAAVKLLASSITGLNENELKLTRDSLPFDPYDLESMARYVRPVEGH